MSLFSKSAYSYLASILRDEIQTTKKIGGLYQTGQEELIENLAIHLEIESPAFSKPQFLHNIFCGINHEENEKCEFDYIPQDK